MGQAQEEQQAAQERKELWSQCFTWAGYNDRNTEHIEVLKEGGPAIKVRTVRPKAEGERWSAIAIKDIMATPDMPNPKDDSQKDVRLGLWCFGRAVSSKAGCETRAGIEQELQNQQPHLGGVRLDAGM